MKSRKQNFDSIKPKRKPRAVVRIKTVTSRVRSRPAFYAGKPHFIVPEKQQPFSVFIRSKVSIFAAVTVLFLGIFTGATVTLNANKGLAEEEPAVSGVFVSQPVEEVATSTKKNLLSMTLGQLENYFAETLKTPEIEEAEMLAERKIKLAAYLEERKSPLVESVHMIAELKHWKMVLAISNSESSLGKRCSGNNCSGIGVEPGHPLWRTYDTKAEWAKDLDELIEKRYKDWTLEEMNGVYNQPGSRNWVFAATQILEDLQERGIE